MKIIDLTNKTPHQLKQLMDLIVISDADDETKKVNIENIKMKLYGSDNKAILKDIYESQPDYDDIF